MRVLVCGSRGFEDIDLMLRTLAEMYDLPEEFTIVEGCARGADHLAEVAADQMRIPIEHHPADWSKGRGAGFQRNIEMLDSGIDLVLAFWDGQSRGTKHTIDQATKRGIEVRVVEYRA